MFLSLLTEQIQIWHGMAEYLHNVDSVIDEVTNLKFPAYSSFILAFEAEPNMIRPHARTRKEVNGFEPILCQDLH